MFETFDDILNAHVHVPSTFSGIAICDVKYIITNINKSLEADVDYIRGGYAPPKYRYSVDFEITGVDIEYSNDN